MATIERKTKKMKHAVVVGAGPSGILTSIQLLKRNWKVTLIEKSKDISLFKDHNRQKSWMIGISKIGTDALCSVPSLFESINECIVESLLFNVFVFGFKLEIKRNSKMVDRNLLVSAMLRFLHNLPESNFNLSLMFDSKVLFVDGAHLKVGVETNDGNIKKIDYDLLVGADGVRSVIRNSLFSQDPSFRCSYESIFTSVKSIYIDAIEGLNVKESHFYTSILDGGTLMLVPAHGDRFNLILSFADNVLIPQALLEDTSTFDILTYLNMKMKRYFKFRLADCEIIMNASWHRISQVKCAPYHIDKNHGSAFLIGDAAHSTHPALGMGLNIALEDVCCFMKLLDEHDHENHNEKEQVGTSKNVDPLDIILSSYSMERMKIGYALTDLAFNLNPLQPLLKLETWVSHVIRTLFHKISFGYIDLPAFTLPSHGVPLDETYGKALKQGAFVRVKASNGNIVENSFLRDIGLLPHSKLSFALSQQKLKIQQKDISLLRLKYEE